MAEQSTTKLPKDPKKKDKKRKRDVAGGAETTEDGFTLVGEQKDAELDDIFGQSVSTAFELLLQDYKSLISSGDIRTSCSSFPKCSCALKATQGGGV